MVDWGERVDWIHRGGEIGELTTVQGEVAAPYYWNGSDPRLAEIWQSLPPHPHLLQMLDHSSLVHYAAIDWQPRGPATAMMLASWTIQVADVFRVIEREVMKSDLSRFGKPMIYIDIGGAARVGFAPANPSTELDTLPRLVARRVLAMELAAGAPPVSALATAMHPVRRKHFGSLETLQRACSKEVLGEPLRTGDALTAWQHVERGMGLLAVEQNHGALDEFRAALAFVEYKDIAVWGRDRALERLDLAVPRSRRRKLPREPIAASTDVIGEARRALEAHDPRYAMSLAQDHLDDHPDDLQAMTVLVNAYFELGHNGEALAYTDALVARAPGEGNYHYQRGKVLFRLGRLPEARDAFERALVLRPTLAEALHLRREVDRAIGSARKTVGSQHAPVLDIPASLEPLRDVLAAGKPRDIIDALSAPDHDTNPDAQLVLARFLVQGGELGRASGIYHRLAEGPDPYRRRGLVGNAGLLLQLGLVDSALALFDVVCAEAPSDLDASEGRAQALERLGRLGEAAAEYRRFVGLANARADLRVRAAQQWLDAHAL